MQTEEKPRPLFLIWFDLETSGLHPTHDRILAVGCRVTTPDLTVLAEDEIVIHVPKDRLADMSPTVRAMHTKSGLLDKVRASHISQLMAEDLIATLIRENTSTGSDRILAGNSIHFDRSFVKLHMPVVDNLLHYRHFDVSMFKTFARVLGITMPKHGEAAHTPLADLDNSARELADFVEFVVGNHVQKLTAFMRAADKLAVRRRNLAIAAGTYRMPTDTRQAVEPEKPHEWCGKPECIHCEQEGDPNDPPTCPICDRIGVSTTCYSCGWKAEIRKPEQKKIQPT